MFQRLGCFYVYEERRLPPVTTLFFADSARGSASPRQSLLWSVLRGSPVAVCTGAQKRSRAGARHPPAPQLLSLPPTRVWVRLPLYTLLSTRARALADSCIRRRPASLALSFSFSSLSRSMCLVCSVIL